VGVIVFDRRAVRIPAARPFAIPGSSSAGARDALQRIAKSAPASTN
jgi:hypothetical protein